VNRVRRVIVFLVITAILLVGSVPSASAVTLEGTEAVLVYEPAELTLRSGESGRVHMEVENTGNRTLYFEVNANGAETSGGAWPDVEPESFMLEPQGTMEVAIDILSRARLAQEPDISDVLIVVYYGPDAKVRTDGSYDVQSPYMKERVRYNVIDEYPVTGSGPHAGVSYIGLILGTILIVPVASYGTYRSIRRGGERPEGT
jgi:hypothetical protein